MSDSQPRRLAVTDANLSDDRIPRNLILMYGDVPYIQKAGLEWKATKLFGKYSLELEPVTIDFEKHVFVFKATMRVRKEVFVNYGQADTSNANSMMQKQLFHLAATRAECRVLRMATACGYASYDEVITQKTITAGKEVKELAPQADDEQPIKDEQKATIRAMEKKNGVEPPVDVTDWTRGQARVYIDSLSKGVSL